MKVERFALLHKRVNEMADFHVGHQSQVKDDVSRKISNRYSEIWLISDTNFKALSSIAYFITKILKFNSLQ